MKLRFISRYRLLAWLPILHRAFFLPTTEVSFASTLHRIAGVLCPMTVPAPAPLQLQIASPLVTVDCPTVTMKRSARHSFPSAVVVSVAADVDAGAAVMKAPRPLEGIPFPLGAWAMLLSAPQNHPHVPSLDTTPNRSAGVNGLSAAPVADWRVLCCARMAVTGTVAKS